MSQASTLFIAFGMSRAAAHNSLVAACTLLLPLQPMVPPARSTPPPAHMRFKPKLLLQSRNSSSESRPEYFNRLYTTFRLDLTYHEDFLLLVDWIAPVDVSHALNGLCARGAVGRQS